MAEKATLAITGMHCASCSTLLERSLTKAGGVDVARIAAVEAGQTKQTEGKVVTTKLNLKVQK